MKRIVLDASALMTFFLGRPGAEKVKEVLLAAGEDKREVLMSVVNWGEVYYSIWRDRGQEDAQRAMAYIAQLPIDVIPADVAQTKVAAEFKARYKLPYADCFAAALARLRKAAIITSDADFAVIEKEIPLIAVFR
ncbi:MAG: type II toxin-antitoxin system VapC family toxin [Candidatus Acidiferrales bacterium]